MIIELAADELLEDDVIQIQLELNLHVGRRFFRRDLTQFKLHNVVGEHVQEATNSHYYKFKTNSKYEKWTELRETRDWTLLEK